MLRSLLIGALTLFVSVSPGGAVIGGGAARAAAPLFGVTVYARANHTSVTIALPAIANFSATIDPNRGAVQIDFVGLTAMPDGSIGRGMGLVRTYHAERYAGGIRLILDLARPAIISGVRAIPIALGRAPQAIIELESAGVAAMKSVSGMVYQPPGAPVPEMPSHPGSSIATLLDKTPTIAPGSVAPPASAGPSLRLPPPTRTSPLVEASLGPALPRPRVSTGKRVVVIDPGHGGIDPGADSIAGYHEKEITLATARALRAALEQTGRYKVVLTRDSDSYLKLPDRVARARAAHGALLISLRADSAASAGSTAHGASIYTLSEKASDTETDRLVQRENRADVIGGVDLGDQSDDVAGILVNLAVRQTVNDGNRLAELVIESLRQQGIGILPTDAHRSAGFAVLKSPDIPSVLLEMGYLSDRGDARDLSTTRHQQLIARAIVAAIDRYYDDSAGRS